MQELGSGTSPLSQVKTAVMSGAIGAIRNLRTATQKRVGDVADRGTETQAALEPPPGGTRREPKQQRKRNSKARSAMSAALQSTFVHVRFNRVHCRITYTGQRVPISMSDFKLVLDTKVYVDFEGSWRDIFSRYKGTLLSSALKSLTGLQGKKFKVRNRHVDGHTHIGQEIALYTQVVAHHVLVMCVNHVITLGILLLPVPTHRSCWVPVRMRRWTVQRRRPPGCRPC